MRRGTTPTFTFTLEFDASLLTKATVSFRQAGGVIIDKDLADCVVESNTLTVSLTEAETLSLRAMTLYPMEIQLRAGIGEARLVSQIWEVPVEHILKDGAL